MEFDSRGRLITNNPKKLTKEEIIFWKNKYDLEEDLYNKGDELEIHKSLNQKNFMSKEDLIKIIKWKFQGRLLGRQKRMLNLLTDCKTEFIENMSREAFKSKDNEERLILLSNIPAVKNSLSSVILTFYDPINYGILDIHSWRELFGEEPKDIFSNKIRAIKFFNTLKEISQETGLSCRDIEKALFKKNLHESKNVK